MNSFPMVWDPSPITKIWSTKHKFQNVLLSHCLCQWMQQLETWPEQKTCWNRNSIHNNSCQVGGCPPVQPVKQWSWYCASMTGKASGGRTCHVIALLHLSFITNLKNVMDPTFSPFFLGCQKLYKISMFFILYRNKSSIMEILEPLQDDHVPWNSLTWPTNTSVVFRAFHTPCPA